jgi:hypothetical protein
VYNGISQEHPDKKPLHEKPVGIEFEDPEPKYNASEIYGSHETPCSLEEVW